MEPMLAFRRLPGASDPAVSPEKAAAARSEERFQDRRRVGPRGKEERPGTERPEDWTSPREELKMFPKGRRQIYDAPRPGGARIPVAARAEGLEKPGR